MINPKSISALAVGLLFILGGGTFAYLENEPLSSRPFRLQHDVASVKLGERVGNFTIQSIAQTADRLPTVVLRGETVVSGRYYLLGGPATSELYSGTVCFWLPDGRHGPVVPSSVTGYENLSLCLPGVEPPAFLRAIPDNYKNHTDPLFVTLRIVDPTLSGAEAHADTFEILATANDIDELDP